MATAQLTPDNDAILAEVFIAAPPARVFQAIADPKQRVQWWGVKDPAPPGMTAFHVTDSSSDLRVGGRWSNEGIRGDGQRFHLEGEYLQIDPPRLLVHTRIADFVDNIQTVVRWELQPHEVRGLHGSSTHKIGTGTLVRVRHSGFAGYQQHVEGHYKGWRASLNWLKAYVERGETMTSRS